GTRFDSKTPKQFVELLGEPIIVHVAKRFAQCSLVDEIIIVCAEEERDRLRSIVKRFPVGKPLRIVIGGATRAESVRNGLETVDSRAEIVAVHDGARPLVPIRDIASTIGKALEFGAACLTAIVVDTIKSIERDEISGTLDRMKLRRALTPQAFRVEILKLAFENIELTDDATDESYLVEKLGHPIAFVDGSPVNIKITQLEDLIIAEALIREERATAHIF
ncbi:MAG: 2-C-methyl-D-erythritol 4-phosphate cytidylyltransferase, partial [Acidobacteria bacterium]|nr:2-C-methyl-D-erythritol 4-phosphate cytidylyltransferase [Acidobacteriota bacterium]